MGRFGVLTFWGLVWGALLLGWCFPFGVILIVNLMILLAGYRLLQAFVAFMFCFADVGFKVLYNLGGSCLFNSQGVGCGVYYFMGFE